MKLKNCDVRFLLNNKQVIEWLTEANEVIQKPKERHLMRTTMSQIPEDFYYKTQLTRGLIGEKVTTSTLCKHIIQLFKGEKVEDQKANELFLRYQSEILQNVSEEIRKPLKENIMLSLKIRSRQLNP